ncbi:hypothetical protein [Acinetobacter parvus]|uniref:Uncharacterized protein n=2 Tax=Acinetobacter parvus TaxID=134533 RepID=N8Q5H1_9GAMM|nr:hypothetical protein [Acinetobacter parvus]ENU33780.1 hypothetical protein F989_01266 [Acinetobacter parvus NIPH 1103]
MRCFARWERDDKAGLFFRDQTILQFGNSWDLLASFILLNPGSSLPLGEEPKTDFLRAKKLPFFVEPRAQEKYVEFSIDRLMRDLITLFSSDYDGGTIKLYNLFNLKNQYSGEAIEQFKENAKHPKMFSSELEIKFCDAPVIVASGSNAKDSELKKQLIKHIQLSPKENLFALRQKETKKYHITRAEVDLEGFVDSYHPSYTFKYGNITNIGELQI